MTVAHRQAGGPPPMCYMRGCENRVSGKTQGGKWYKLWVSCRSGDAPELQVSSPVMDDFGEAVTDELPARIEAETPALTDEEDRIARELAMTPRYAAWVRKGGRSAAQPVRTNYRTDRRQPPDTRGNIMSEPF